MANFYYYDNNGRKIGPMNNAQLKALARKYAVSLPKCLIQYVGKVTNWASQLYFHSLTPPLTTKVRKMTTVQAQHFSPFFSLVMLIAAFAAAAVPFAEAREWKLESGKITTGEFIEVIDDEGVQKVRIKKEDGQITRIKLTSLSEKDREFVEEQSKKTEKKTKPAPAGKVKIDENTPLDVLKEQAEKGNTLAQCRLGVCYYNGKGVSKNLAEAAKWFRKAAEQGYALAQCRLGICYATGEGVPENFAEAAKWYRKAAEQGYALAQCRLGTCYANGEGVPENSAEAAKWYRKAAEQGYARAQCCLGDCYANGEGVPENFAEAVKWYRKAAEQGDAAAQYDLGVCYGDGQGVPKDLVEAVKWFRKAAEQGHPNAKKVLELLKQ
jgi:TPR repeat protein